MVDRIEEFNQRMNLMINEIRDPFPEFVYHYTSTRALISILKTKNLWATHSKFLNDPNEISSPFGDFGNRVFSALERYREQYKMYISKEIPDQFPPKVFFTSFTIESDSQIIWRQYGKSDGYNLKMNVRTLEETAKTSIVKKHFGDKVEECEIVKTAMFLPVIYEKNKQEKIIDFFVREIVKNTESVEEIGDSNFNKLQSHVMRQAISQLVSFKDESYKHEQEYRLVFILTNPDLAEDYYDREGIICPYIEYSIDGGLPIEGVTVGPKINDEIAIYGLRRIASKYGWELNEGDIFESKVKIRF